MSKIKNVQTMSRPPFVKNTFKFQQEPYPTFNFPSNHETDEEDSDDEIKNKNVEHQP